MNHLLTQQELEIINEKFHLDLDYGNAIHYRAAMVIWNLWKDPAHPISHSPDYPNTPPPED
jgi:hypothetical protein